MSSRLISVVLSLSFAACSNEEPVNGSRASGGAPAPAAPAAPASATPSRDDRKYLLERVDDAAVVQLYADGFSSLPLREKTLIWHLSQAAIAGRDIYIDQKHRNALEMRAVLEAIVSHPQGVDPVTLGDIQRYT